MPPYLTKADIIMEIKADLLFLPAIGHFCKAVFSRHPCLQGREDQLAYKLELIIYEASSNVIRHAYTSQEQGKLKLKLQFDEGRIILQVIDFGPGFDPSSIPTPDVTNPQVSGMGLYIIRKTVDILKYGFSEQEGGNVLHMEKQL
ncbi:MAG: ATP-binding protein [Desulfovermiculus sp.]